MIDSVNDVPIEESSYDKHINKNINDFFIQQQNLASPQIKGIPNSLEISCKTNQDCYRFQSNQCVKLPNQKRGTCLVPFMGVP